MLRVTACINPLTRVALFHPNTYNATRKCCPQINFGTRTIRIFISLRVYLENIIMHARFVLRNPL